MAEGEFVSSAQCASSNNIVGAHVQLADGGKEWYIVPLCQNCNISLKDRDLCFWTISSGK